MTEFLRYQMPGNLVLPMTGGDGLVLFDILLLAARSAAADRRLLVCIS